MNKLAMPMFYKNDVVRCVELAPENPEGLILFEDYVVLGYSYFGNDIVYSLKDSMGDVVYAMGGYFVKQITNPCGITPVGDPVNHPSHYCDGGIETIDFIQAKLSQEGFQGYLIGNITKYLSRAGKKDALVQDLKKARWYLDKLISVSEDVPEEVEPEHELPMSKKQQGYIAGLTSALDLDRTNLPDYISPIPDYHVLTEAQATTVIDRLLVIKTFLRETDW